MVSQDFYFTDFVHLYILWLHRLWPFYVGCMEVMKAHGYLTNKSIVAGTSGGSIAALIACCDVLSSEEILKISVNMGTNRNFMNNIDAGLKSTIRSLLPHDALQRCNGRLHIVTTKLWPAPTLTPTVISTFCDEEMLIDAVAASCFIPLYSARRLYTHIHGFGKSQFIDGGVLAFMPPIGDVKISPFKQGLLRRQVPATIYLDQLVYSRPRLVVYSLKPDPKVIYHESLFCVHSVLYFHMLMIHS